MVCIPNATSKVTPQRPPAQQMDFSSRALKQSNSEHSYQVYRNLHKFAPGSCRSLHQLTLARRPLSLTRLGYQRIKQTILSNMPKNNLNKLGLTHLTISSTLLTLSLQDQGLLIHLSIP